MRKTGIIFFITITAVFCWNFLSGQTYASDSYSKARQQYTDNKNEGDFQIRVNPEMDDYQKDGVKKDYHPFNSYTQPKISYPEFINLKSNYIELNGADWGPLCDAIRQASTDGPAVNILHIGDSHIQADGATGVTRELMQQAFGNAGRGLITPLKLCKTNEPRDYSISSTSAWTTSILLKTPWQVTPGFTGVGIKPVHPRSFDLTVSTLTTNFGPNHFNAMRIFYTGSSLKIEGAMDASGIQLAYLSDMDFNMAQSTEYSGVFETEPSRERVLDITFPKMEHTVTLQLSADASTVISGIELICDRPGIRYSSIGNNGAAYLSYNNLGGVGKGCSALSPDLIIIAMGCNEAFGRISDEDFYRSIDEFVVDMRRYNPASDFLLVTPMECQKSVRGKGRSKKFSVNNDILRLRNVILKYGRDKGVPVYDFYSVAGREGASDKWLSHELMNKDRIHLTWEGYKLQGELTFDALYQIFNTDTQK